MTYETYEPAASPTADVVRGPWRVAVEYSNQGQAKPSTVVQIGNTEFQDHAFALATAQRTAFEYKPPDPWSPQGREVFRDGPDGFLVVIQGVTATFHMSVRLVEHVGSV